MYLYNIYIIIMGEVINILAYLGITKETVIPLVLVFGAFYFLLIRPKINRLDNDMNGICNAVNEIQTLLRQKFHLTFTQTLMNKYGQANSPIRLKSEYMHYITDVALDKQIKKKLPQLVEWLKKEKPATGLDAQEDIFNFVASKQIDRILDLEKYKQNLYEKGKTINDADAILGVYLFEVLIPEVIKE